MVELAGMLSVFVQPDIEIEEGFDGLDEVSFIDSELITKINEATILIEEA